MDKIKEKIILYGHGGSGNRGCEALVRTVIEQLNGEITLYSGAPDEDIEAGLNKLCKIASNTEKSNKTGFLKKLLYKLNPGKNKDNKIIFGNLIKEKNVTAVLIGGDNYCYMPDREQIIFVNKKLRKNGCGTILMGASVEPELLKCKRLIKDLAGYEIIYARESITYRALINAGLTNVKFQKDTAFNLKPAKIYLPGELRGFKYICVNASPLVINARNTNDIILKNYIKLMEHILNNTNYKIALIPHVIKCGNDDRTVLKILYDKFNGGGRVVNIEAGAARELKAIIAGSAFCVGARTHLTIAGYSSGVPTLAVGYSVKSTGIARDLFGTEENYVLNIRNIVNTDELTKAFVRLKEKTENEQQQNSVR